MIPSFIITLGFVRSLVTDRFMIQFPSDCEFRKKCAKETNDNSIGMPQDFSIPAKRRVAFCQN